MKEPTISLCMLLCNEGEALKECLDSAKGLYDELIIVDTGSKDESIEIAEEHEAKIVKVKWRDDFAWARNQGLKLAKCDWVFILDPDETIAEKDVDRFRALTKIKDVVAWQIPTRNYTNNSVLANFKANKGEYEEEKGFRGYVQSGKTRLFKRSLGLEFEGVVHEMVDYQAFRRKLEGRNVGIPVHHRPGGKRMRSGTNKNMFMVRICEKKVELDPSDRQAWWELGAVQHTLGLNKSALRSMKKSIKLGYKKPDNIFVVAMILKSLGRIKESERYFEKAICLMNPELTHIKEEYRKLSI